MFPDFWTRSFTLISLNLGQSLSLWSPSPVIHNGIMHLFGMGRDRACLSGLPFSISIPTCVRRSKLDSYHLVETVPWQLACCCNHHKNFPSSFNQVEMSIRSRSFRLTCSFHMILTVLATTWTTKHRFASAARSCVYLSLLRVHTTVASASDKLLTSWKLSCNRLDFLHLSSVDLILMDGFPNLDSFSRQASQYYSPP